MPDQWKQPDGPGPWMAGVMVHKIGDYALCKHGGFSPMIRVWTEGRSRAESGLRFWEAVASAC